MFYIDSCIKNIHYFSKTHNHITNYFKFPFVPKNDFLRYLFQFIIILYLSGESFTYSYDIHGNRKIIKRSVFEKKNIIFNSYHYFKSIRVMYKVFVLIRVPLLQMKTKINSFIKIDSTLLYSDCLIH